MISSWSSFPPFPFVISLCAIGYTLFYIRIFFTRTLRLRFDQKFKKNVWDEIRSNILRLSQILQLSYKKPECRHFNNIGPIF